MSVNQDQELTIRRLDGLSDSEIGGLSALSVSDQQEGFGGSFLESLTVWRAESGEHLQGYAFHHRGQPVGMTLFKRPPLSPGWVPKDAASIHGLKIASQWQGRGWGHHAMRLAVRHLQSDWPNARTLWLAVDAENSAALSVYVKFGMIDSGPVYRGRVGMEHRLHIALGDE